MHADPANNLRKKNVSDFPNTTDRTSFLYVHHDEYQILPICSCVSKFKVFGVGASSRRQEQTAGSRVRVQ
jgi:hypothetical protein